MRKGLRYLFTIINSLLILGFNYGLVFLVLYLTFFKNNYLIALLITMAIMIVNYLFSIIAMKLFNRIDTKDKDTLFVKVNEAETKLIEEIINEVIKQARQKSAKIDIKEIIYWDSNNNSKDNLIARKALNGSPLAVVGMKTIIIDYPVIKNMDHFLIKAILGHELGHLSSSYINIKAHTYFYPNFWLEIGWKIIWQIPFVFLNIARNLNNKILGIITYSFFVLLYGLLFILRLPYNLLFSWLDMAEEIYSDDFSCQLGYYDGIKYYFGTRRFQAGRTYAEEVVVKLLMPIHPFDQMRLKRANRLGGYLPEEVTYFYDGNVLVEYNGITELLIIPHKVKDIGNGKHSILYNSQTISMVKSVLIEEGAIKINDYAFQSLPINMYQLPNSLKIIGKKAFKSNYNLKKIALTNSIVELHDGAFQNCYNLEQVSLSNSLEAIFKQSFFNCQKITNIELPNSLKLLGAGAFENCTQLKKVLIPFKTSLAKGCFKNCHNITEIVINEGVIIIPDDFCQNCLKLETINLPQSITSIGNNAFMQCQSLKSIYINENVMYIGSNAFSNCNNLVIKIDLLEANPQWNSLWNISQCLVEWKHSNQ